MTGTTWILAAVAIFALIYIIGYRARRAVAQHQLEDQIPGWVNQGNRAVIGQYEEILAALHEAAHIELWETQFKKDDQP